MGHFNGYRVVYERYLGPERKEYGSAHSDSKGHETKGPLLEGHTRNVVILGVLVSGRNFYPFNYPLDTEWNRDYVAYRRYELKFRKRGAAT